MAKRIHKLCLFSIHGMERHVWRGVSVAGPGRFERNTVMKASQLPTRMSLTEMFSIRKAQHWGGLAFVLGNVLFVVNKLDEMSRLFLSRPMPDLISGQNPGLILLGQVALIIRRESTA